MDHLVANFASNLMEKCNEIALENFGKNVKRKNNDMKIDFVTDGDILIEKHITDQVLSTFPDHNIIGEEGSNFNNGGEYTWIIDPIDGTINYANTNPSYGISIAIKKKDKTIYGIISFPFFNEIFECESSGIPKLNKKEFKIINKIDSAEGIIVSGNLIRSDIQKMNDDWGLIPRISGSAVIDLCYLASNRIQGLIYRNLKPWDYEAGALIAKQAGACCNMEKDFIVMAHPDVFEYINEKALQLDV